MPSINKSETIWKLRYEWFFFKQKIYTVISFLSWDSNIGSIPRALVLRALGVKIGRGCHIRGNLQIVESFRLILGDGVFINNGCTLDLSDSVSIGNRVQVGFNVTFITGSHSIGPKRDRAGDRFRRPIVVGDGSWIGAGATIMPGVTIGEGAIVAAGALVTKDVAANSLVAGVPARVMKELGLDGD